MATATANPISLTETKMTDGTVRLKLMTPYHPALPAKARNLGGKWNTTSKAWYFDLRDKERVQAVCVEVYGLDPLAEAIPVEDLVTARIEVHEAIFSMNNEFWLFGRQIVRQMTRDSAPMLGAGVVVLDGGFRAGGSRKHPSLIVKDGTVIEVRDVPRVKFTELHDSLAAKADRAREMLEKYQSDTPPGDPAKAGDMVAYYAEILRLATSGVTEVSY